MHGAIFESLKRFVGATAWDVLTRDAGLVGRDYRADSIYPDEDAVLLVGAIARATGAEPEAVLEQFGSYLGRELLHAHRALVEAMRDELLAIPEKQLTPINVDMAAAALSCSALRRASVSCATSSSRCAVSGW